MAEDLHVKMNLEKKVHTLEETLTRHANLMRDQNERLAKAGFTYNVRFSSR